MPLCLGQLSCTPETRVSHLSLSYEHSKVPGGWRLRWLLGLRLQEIFSVWSLKSFLSSKWEQLLSPTDVGQCVTTLLPCRPRAAASPPHLHPSTRLPAPHKPDPYFKTKVRFNWSLNLWPDVIPSSFQSPWHLPEPLGNVAAPEVKSKCCKYNNHLSRITEFKRW